MLQKSFLILFFSFFFNFNAFAQLNVPTAVDTKQVFDRDSRFQTIKEFDLLTLYEVADSSLISPTDTCDIPWVFVLDFTKIKRESSGKAMRIVKSSVSDAVEFAEPLYDNVTATGKKINIYYYITTKSKLMTYQALLNGIRGIEALDDTFLDAVESVVNK